MVESMERRRGEASKGWLDGIMKQHNLTRHMQQQIFRSRYSLFCPRNDLPLGRILDKLSCLLMSA